MNLGWNIDESTISHDHSNGLCQQTAQAKRGMSLDQCKYDCDEWNTALDAQIAKLKGMDVSAEITRLQALKK